MKPIKMFCLFMICLLTLGTTACGNGSSGTVSEWSAADDQGATDGWAAPSTPADNSVSEDTESDGRDSDDQRATGGGPEPSTPANDSVSEGDSPPVLKPPIINPVWQKIPDSRLDSVAYDWSPNPTPGYFRGLFAWSGGALDTKRNRLLIHGGGHADYGGQEIYAFDFDTYTWSLVAEPDTHSAIDGDKQLCNYGGRTSNNYPKSVHTYDRPFFNSVMDALCDPRGSIGYKSCTAGAEMACYVFDTNEWVWKQGYLTSDIIGGSGVGAAVDPNTGDYWIQGTNSDANGRLGHYDVSEDTWEKGSYDASLANTFNKNAVIDSTNSVFIITNTYKNGTTNIYAMPLSEFTTSVDVSDYKLTLSGTGPEYGVDGYPYMGMAYDPVSDNVVFWNGDPTVYFLEVDADAGTGKWTSTRAKGTAPVFPGEPSYNGTFGRFQYIPSLDKIALVNAVNEDVYLLDLRNEVVSENTTFQLNSSTTQKSSPFTTAVGFKKGEVTGTPTLDLDYYQVDVKRRWNDGSVKHAIFSGYYDSTSGQPKTVTVFNGDSSPAGNELTEADILAANPAAFVSLGSYGSINLVDLLESPDRIWLQGPKMIEAHYSADVGSDPDLVVKFHVRLYAEGHLRIRAIVENGTINGRNETKSYIPTITIGGIKVYDNGGESLNHYAHTRWSATGWIGSVDPQVTVAHDTEYIKETKLVPNYWKDGPSDTRLDKLSQVYRPMSVGDWRENMGTAGYHGQIGILPLWDALYINSGGDSRAYRSVLANADALNSYPIVWSDSTTDSPIVLSSWPTWTVSGVAAGGATGWNAGNANWDVAHHGSGGYLAYLITGDYYYLETMENQAATIFLITSSARGSGVNRIIEPVQTRGVAWATRTVGQLVAIGPLDAIVSDFQSQFLNSMDHWQNVISTPGINNLGFFQWYWSGSWDGKMAFWMQHFFTMSLGYLSDLEPLQDMTNLNAVKNHIYKSVVGVLGPNGSDNFCYTRAGDDYVYVSSERPASKDPTTWFDSWGDVYYEQYGEYNTNCGTTLESIGSLASNPASTTGYWANLLPAIAYAVEDGAPGAAEAWNRLAGADNWSEIENAGFENTPIWGIVPRGWE